MILSIYLSHNLISTLLPAYVMILHTKSMRKVVDEPREARLIDSTLASVETPNC